MNSPLPALLRRLEMHPFPIVELKLERMRLFLERIGHPEHRIPPIIHVAGTNGKGSVLAFLHAMIKAAGLTAHRYTSPHLVSFHERFIVANTIIDDASLCAALQRLTRELDAFPLTYFESATALAFQLFAEYPADFTLLEVGLGGQFDATNVIEHPVMTVMMPISLDHEDMLGDTIAKIAYEKACIMKAESPCVIGHQPRDALDVMEEYARHIHAPLFRLGSEWNYEVTPQGALHYHSSTLDIITPSPSLAGLHQYGNAATAIACMDILSRTDERLTTDAMARGVASTHWAGRLQRVTTTITHHTVYVDGGHNPSAAAHIGTWMAEQSLPVHVIVGMHYDKDVASVLTLLAQHAATITTVTIPRDTKALAAEVLAMIARDAGLHARAASTVSDAIAFLTVTNDAHMIILITGSLYLVGEALTLLGQVP